jgi:acetylornithine deacetylase/succinyl-diaminopimelate desuccinylase-like protein
VRTPGATARGACPPDGNPTYDAGMLQSLVAPGILSLACLSLACAASAAAVQPPPLSPAEQAAHDILRELVEIPSTESGVGSTPAARAIEKRLLAAGFAREDVQVVGPNERKMNLVARLRGRGQGRPILLLAHLDVVEARAEDWSPDLPPFRFVERDGYYYGRGTQDIKDGAALLTANFIRWKEEGWVPSRDLVLALTADEEGGDDNGVEWLLAHRRELVDAGYCLNTDSGDFQSKDGRPYIVSLAAAEKKATAMRLETTNPGGHGSLPRKDNAIYALAAALGRVEAFRFPVMLSPLTRAQLERTAALETGRVTDDLRAAAAGTAEDAVLARLSENPQYNALLRTTCVATLVEAGHAANALPQRARATLNCRILPGHDPADVLAAVRRAVADDRVEVGWEYIEKETAPASPMNDEVMRAVESTAARLWPGVAVMPLLELGGSDGRFLRAAGIPTYGASGVFIDVGDVRAHGRDERVRAKDVRGGLAFYDGLVRALAR